MHTTEIYKEISATRPSNCDFCFIDSSSPVESMSCQLCPFVLLDIEGYCSICGKPFAYKGISRGNIDNYAYCPEHKKEYDEFRKSNPIMLN